MKSVQLVNYPLVGELSIGDVPVFDDGRFRVYFLVSKYEDIRVKIGHLTAGPFKHVAVDGTQIYIYDDKAQRIVGGSLGQYEAFELVKGEGQWTPQATTL
jgi:hypothetical protein